MNDINVISIDPSRETKASMHPELFRDFAKKYKDIRDSSVSIDAKPMARSIINFLFGINKRVSTGVSVKLLILRVVIGSILIAYAGLSFEGNQPTLLTWTELILGASIITGFFSRIVSIAALSLIGYACFSDFLNLGTFDFSLTLPLLTSVVFLIIGPGIFSFDQLFRCAFFRIAKRREHIRAIKLAQDRLSYKAYQCFLKD